MELIVAILNAFAAAHDVVEVTDWLLERVRTWSGKTPIAKIEQRAGKLADVTEADIREQARKILSGRSGPAVPDEQREELIAVLHNLTRNVRYRRSFGTLNGSSFRSERLLEALIMGAEPFRHQNEPVSPKSAWILRRHLGMGGFGEVWMAQNPGYPNARAYKFFRDGSGEWLRRERDNLIAILKRLGEHDHIVKFLDVHTDCEYPHLALEYLGGGSLEEWIVKDDGARPKLEPDEIVRQVVSALAAAHSQGIAHRDVKPSNILLTEGPNVRVKLGDFGLARVGNAVRPGASHLASLVGLVGTALYLPPEASVRSVPRDPMQDDVFAVGVVWYQIAVGAIERPPYDFAQQLRSRGWTATRSA